MDNGHESLSTLVAGGEEFVKDLDEFEKFLLQILKFEFRELQHDPGFIRYVEDYNNGRDEPDVGDEMRQEIHRLDNMWCNYPSALIDAAAKDKTGKALQNIPDAFAAAYRDSGVDILVVQLFRYLELRRIRCYETVSRFNLFVELKGKYEL
jgi:hypothetical protein